MSRTYYIDYNNDLAYHDDGGWTCDCIVYYSIARRLATYPRRLPLTLVLAQSYPAPTMSKALWHADRSHVHL